MLHERCGYIYSNHLAIDSRCYGTRQTACSAAYVENPACWTEIGKIEEGLGKCRTPPAHIQLVPFGARGCVDGSHPALQKP